MVVGIDPMSAPLKTIALLGYEPPAVKDGEVVVPVRINGGLFELRGSPGVMRALAGDVLRVLNPAPRAGRPAQRSKRADFGRIAEYRAAWRHYIATPDLRIRRLADNLGVTEAALSRWFRLFRAEGGAPAVKPNGKL